MVLPRLVCLSINRITRKRMDGFSTKNGLNFGLSGSRNLFLLSLTFQRNSASTCIAYAVAEMGRVTGSTI